MKILKPSSKKAIKYIQGYFNAVDDSVLEFYKKCSTRKVEVEADIKHAMRMHNRRNDVECKASGYKVLWGNCHNFTCGYVLDTNNGDEINRYLVIDTYSETYYIHLATVAKEYW